MYPKQEDDEMKKVGFTIEFGKTEEKERGKNFVSGIEALARRREKRFSAAVNDAGWSSMHMSMLLMSHQQLYR